MAVIKVDATLLSNNGTKIASTTSFSPLPITPGTTAYASVSNIPGVITGSTYTVQIAVTYANGVTQTITTSVVTNPF